MTPTSSLAWAQLQEAFATGDTLAKKHQLALTAVMTTQDKPQAEPLALLLDAIERYNNGERGLVEQQLAQVVPVIAQMGLFNLFSPSEWMSSDNPGRRLAGLFAGQYLAGPQK